MTSLENEVKEKAKEVDAILRILPQPQGSVTHYGELGMSESSANEKRDSNTQSQNNCSTEGWNSPNLKADWRRFFANNWGNGGTTAI